jgi:hypothetical protein
MASADEVQRLLLAVEGAEEVAKLTQAYGNATAALSQLRADLQQGVITQQQYAAQARIVGADMIDLARDAKTAQDRVDQLNASFAPANSNLRGGAAAAREVNWALQDLVQGGLGGVINNIPGLVTALGGGAGLAGVLGLVALAVYAVKEPLTQFAGWLLDGTATVPEAATLVERLAERVKGLKAQIEELKKGGITPSEMPEFISLTAKAAEATKQLNDETERANALKAARKQDADAKNDKDAGEAFRILLGQNGGTDDVVNQLQTINQQFSPDVVNARRRVDELSTWKSQYIAQYGLMAGVFDPEFRKADEDLKKAQGDLSAADRKARTDAESDVIKARDGDVDAIQRIAGKLPVFDDATPEALARSDREADAELEKDALYQVRRKAQREAAADNRAIDNFTDKAWEAEKKGRVERQARRDDNAKRSRAATQKRREREAQLRERRNSGPGPHDDDILNLGRFARQAAEIQGGAMGDMMLGGGELASRFERLSEQIGEIVRRNTQNAGDRQRFAEAIERLEFVLQQQGDGAAIGMLPGISTFPGNP